MLYGFLAIKWHLFDDFYNVAAGRIGGHKIPRPKGKDLAIFIAGKVVFFSLAFVIPMLMHPVLGGACGLRDRRVRQRRRPERRVPTRSLRRSRRLPRAVANAQGGERIETEWAVHQVQTTVDFARGNRFLCWFLGGLNFQVEHHLFHNICHVHYPALSKVVEEACKEFGVRYAANRTFLGAVASHFRWLVQMGRPTATA